MNKDVMRKIAQAWEKKNQFFGVSDGSYFDYLCECAEEYIDAEITRFSLSVDYEDAHKQLMVAALRFCHDRDAAPMPCPFCGTDGTIAGDGHGLSVCCPNDDCASSGSWSFRGTNAEEEAVKLWNRRRVAGWVKLSESKPEYGQKILVAGTTLEYRSTSRRPFVAAAVYQPYEHISMFHLDGCEHSGYEWEWDFLNEDITHWMPLPEPPAND